MIGLPRSSEAVRQQAATWVARLKDAHSEADRKRFEEWVARDPDHQRAYDRAAAAYAASAALSATGVGRSRDLDAAFRSRRVPHGAGLVTAALAGILIVGIYEFRGGFSPFQPVAIESVMLSTDSVAKEVRLADGSTVSMGPQSEVRIDLNRTGRTAEVRRGKVRLAIAREKRPFIIVAGKARVQADEGLFAAEAAGTSGTITPIDLQAGHRRWSAASDRDGAQSQNPSATNASKALEFDAEPLGEAIDRINRVQAGPRLELDQDLANLRVTGLFEYADSAAIGRSLAIAFNLHLMETPTGTLRLTRKNK